MGRPSEFTQETPENQVISRNPDGTFPEGVSGNPAGRPKGKTMKEFAREFLLKMDDKEKEKWLSGLSPEIVWRMAEGNPKQDTDLTSGGESLNPILVKFIDGESSNNRDTG